MEHLDQKNCLPERKRNANEIEKETLKNAGNGTNPMLISLVMQCLLQYLNFEDVKNVRYISKAWSSIALNVLKTRSRIKFSQKKDCYSTDRTPLNFFSTFPLETLDTVPFTDFTISGYHFSSSTGHSSSKVWTVEEVNHFFRNQQNHIKKLDIYRVNLVNENRHLINRYDISSWLMNSAMTKPNTKYNTSIGICGNNNFDYNYDVVTLFSVRLSALANIKELRFSDCEIDIQDGIVIKPNEIQIGDVLFYKNEDLLTEICINDIFDLSNIKTISLDYSDDEELNKATKMILDMDGGADKKLDYLTFGKITLKNFRTCRWTVNHLDWKYLPFTESSDMEIKTLTICNSEVDISVLPQSIEELYIFLINRRDTVCSQPIVLQNLKVIKLNFCAHSEILEFLQSGTFKCPFLVELHLENLYQPFKEIELAWIPRSLKTLKLRNISIEDEGVDYNLNLDKLVLNEYAANQVEDVCGTYIKAKSLVLCFSYDNICNIDDFLNFLSNQNICRDGDQRIYAGRFNWNEYSENGFEDSPLRCHVDREAEYYVFENQIGKAIDFEEFQNEKE